MTAVPKFHSYASHYYHAPDHSLTERIGLRVLSLFGLVEDAFRLAAYALHLNDGSINPWYGREIKILPPVVEKQPVLVEKVETPKKDETSPTDLLTDAAIRGKVNTLRNVLGSYKLSAEDIQEAFMAAAQHGQFLVVRELLKTRKEDLDNDTIDEALIWAVTERHYEVFDVLLESGRIKSASAEKALNLTLRHPIFWGDNIVRALVKHVTPDGLLLISHPAASEFLRLARKSNRTAEERVILELRPHAGPDQEERLQAKPSLRLIQRVLSAAGPSLVGAVGCLSAGIIFASRQKPVSRFELSAASVMVVLETILIASAILKSKG